MMEQIRACGFWIYPCAKRHPETDLRLVLPKTPFGMSQHAQIGERTGKSHTEMRVRNSGTGALRGAAL